MLRAAIVAAIVTVFAAAAESQVVLPGDGLRDPTADSKGTAIIRGRVGSLLEVGTGFSGELTGRENVFLNGSILGMKRREIQQKLPDIV